MKRPIVEARPDPNFPGLKVCAHGCQDEKDPYRLPARVTERIALQYPRPDVSVATQDNGIVTQPNGQTALSTQQSGATPSQNGNQQTITTSP
ncbi:MAG TPA: hypothetical protein PLQ34_09885 [Ferrovaceae bacterium]|nr:hypothetical protein [Ferrovaceae bacterium]